MFIIGTIITLCLIISAIWPKTTTYVVFLVPIFFILILVDSLFLSSIQSQIFVERKVEKMLSLGDVQEIMYTISNNSSFPLSITIYDDLPIQLQLRKEIWQGTIHPYGKHIHHFKIKPTSRGVYEFGNINALVCRTIIPLTRYMVTFQDSLQTKVYPSIIQMQNVEFFISAKTSHKSGIKRVRSIGDDDEFDHLRSYVVGNNIKHINWYATSRKGELIVNQFQDMRHQDVYMIIDKGRSMEMPFYGLSLMDYAINTALAFTKIIIKKHDRAGLITYNNVVDYVVGASSNSSQLNVMLDALYAQETQFKESNLKVLYTYLRKSVSKRSIIFLFTNFENIYEVRRNMAFLRLISKNHLLVIVTFVNEEVERMTTQESNTLSQIYDQTIAESILYDKERIIKEISSEGIMTLLSRPGDLTIDVINKYLEIKARRLK
jgi:uncharacterized protein (DUF58 family)